MRSIRHLLVGVLLTGGAVACSESTSAGGGTTVSVQNNFFDPASVTVAVGQAVTWVWNSGGSTHNVIFLAPDVSPANCPTQGSGNCTRTFGTAGTFNYQCTIHPGMSGRVVVQ